MERRSIYRAVDGISRKRPRRCVNRISVYFPVFCIAKADRLDGHRTGRRSQNSTELVDYVVTGDPIRRQRRLLGTVDVT